jgi:origin recognition complex subunit 3
VAKKSKPGAAPPQEPLAEEEEDALRPEDVPLSVQARFARAVTELQFLGLVKPTKRKVDHVQRLTWGHV